MCDICGNGYAMTNSYPALRGKFGKIEYFLTTMPVGELVSRVRFPIDLPDWENRSIEERFQRKIDMRRIKRDIAPYFANDENRFSGSLVLAVLNNDHMTLESLHDVGVGNRIPKLYDDVVKDMGFLIMSGEEVLVPLDGQHRAKAFKLAIEGYKDNNSATLIQPNSDLAKDKVAVILVRFDRTMSRYIFNKINRYAKPTTKADKLITDDDNAVAVITRRLISDDIIPERLVNIDTNALNKTAHEFTTLSTFYDANLHLLSSLPIVSIGNPEKMAPSERDMRLTEISSEWKRLISGIDLWNKALKNPTKKGDDTRRKIREEHVLGKPIGQLSLVGGYAFACQRNRRNVNRGALVKKLNQIDWRVRTKMWSGVLVRPNGRIMSGRPAAKNAIKFISHLIGAKLTTMENRGVLEWIYGDKWKIHSLPKPIK